MRVALASALVLWVAVGAAWARGVAVVGGMVHQATLQPGEKREGSIELRNTASEPREVRVYATDYVSHADGRQDYREPAGKAPRSNASWISFSPRQVTVPPGQTAFVYYSIQVPQDSTLRGTHWSMLMVEPLAPAAPAPTKGKDGEITVGVRTVVRYAIQMITDIGENGTRDLRFADKQLLATKDRRILQLDVENKGEYGLRPLLWAELFDAKGASMGRLEGGRQRLYPGCSGRFQIDLTKVPKGTYTALVVADNGDEHAFGTRLKLNIP